MGIQQPEDIIPAACFAEMKLQFVPFSLRLSPWVQCVWLVRENVSQGVSFQEKLYPDAGSSLTFEISQTGADVTLFHQAKIFTYRWALSARYISIRLRPGAIAALFGIPVEDMQNQWLTLTKTDALCRLLDYLPTASSARQLAAIEQWLLTLSEQADNVQHKWHLLLNSAFTHVTPPQQLSEQYGLSRRTLERQLRRRFGFSPNQLYGFAQIRHARELLMSSQDELSEIALKCGFYDQAHFTNSFHERVHETPLQYRKRKLSQISN